MKSVMGDCPTEFNVAVKSIVLEKKEENVEAKPI